MSEISFYEDSELDNAIQVDAEIMAGFTTIEELEAAQHDNDVYMSLLERLTEAGGSDDHSGASFWAVRAMAYRILKEKEAQP